MRCPVIKNTMSVSKEHIEDLLIRYLDGECTSVEQQEVVELLKTEEHKTYFDEIKKIHERVAKSNQSESVEVDMDLAWENIGGYISASDTVDELPRINTALHLNIQRVMKYAAILLAVVGISYFFFVDNEKSTPLAEINEPTVDEINIIQAVAREDKLDLKTADGSEISLRKKGKLSYPKKFEGSERVVKLEGEAFFTVVRNEKMAYMVHVQDVTIEVLGTSFLVKEMDDLVEVKVKNGSVKLYPTSDEKAAIVINKGEHGIYNVLNGTLTKKDLEGLNYASWHNNVLKFNGARMSSVVKDLKNHYGVEIQLANNDISGCTLTGQFKNRSIDEVLDNIKDSFDYQIKEQEGVIIIDGKGCAD